MLDRMGATYAGDCAACEHGEVLLFDDGRVQVNCALGERKCHLVAELAELGIRILDGRLKRDA